MSDKQIRSFASMLEVRDTAGSGRTLSGRAAPYGEVADIVDFAGSYQERFAPGAFARSIAERGAAGKVKLFAMHDRQSFPIGTVQPREEADGLWIESRISNTQAGNDALTLVRDGLVTGLSVGMRVVQDSWAGDVREIREASLLEVSLVSEPAYAGAGVTSLRAQRDELAQPPISIAAAYLRLYELR